MSDQPPPTTDSGERDTLCAFLGYLRTSVLSTLDGAPEPAVREPGVASGTNVLGLVTHLTAVERFTFLGEAPDDWQVTFHADDAASVDDVRDAYRAAVAEADAVIAATDLDDPIRRPGKRLSMRWALVHMIEETGRHAGHADILRELIDGATGR
ncbi:DinB family protein [Nocardioides marinquilinus]|uniref:DinB family protein n=1 Tax=Nocardioides marinquilinus TaxID=1210400 RepID=A0ABP9Q2K4_9ACTN